ncbi:MAG: hypothetical protein ACYTFG_03700 [Planctomycetota bacterium]|jgi:hypothetical protein
MAEIKSTWVFGTVARKLGLIDEEQAREGASTQEELEGEGISLRFGEVLVEGGVLKDGQVEEVLKTRIEEQPDPGDGTFGAIAVDNEFLTPSELDDCLAVQQDLAEELSDPGQIPKIGEIILTEELMEPAEVEAVLKVQQRLKLGAFSLTPSKMLLLKKKRTSLKVRSPEEALFCKTAVRRQLLTPGQVAEILQMQSADPRPRSVGEIAYDLGFMDQLDVASLQEKVARKEGVKERRKKHQTTAGIKLIAEDVEFSSAALKNGFVTEAQLKDAERTYKILQYVNFARNLGEIFFDKGLLSSEQIRAILDIQRLKGGVLPAYRLEEVELTEREDELLSDLIKEGDSVSQDQVTECLKIQRELRKLRIRRKIGEIMLVKGYLFREDLKRRPVVRRDRGRARAALAERRETHSSSTAIIGAAVAAVALVSIILVIALALSGKKPRKAPRGGPDKGSTTTVKRGESKPGSAGKKPPSDKDMVVKGYVNWKGVWIHKEKHKANSRNAFYKALRGAVSDH